MKRSWCLSALVLLISPLSGHALANSASASNLPLAAEVHQFVVKEYPHGVPYGEARRLGPSAVPHLTSLLDEEAMKPHWRTIVQVLNYCGSPDAFAVLHNFVTRRFGGDIDVTTTRAIGAAITSMGPLARLSPQAMEFLERGVRPGGLGDIRWRSARLPGDERDKYLLSAFLSALASSGTTRADYTFQQLMALGSKHPLWSVIEPHLEEMRAANIAIISEGFESHRMRMDEHHQKYGGKERN